MRGGWLSVALVWAILLRSGGAAADGVTIVPIPPQDRMHYADGRPAAEYRIAGVRDAGVVLAHGHAPAYADIYGARDVWVFRAGRTAIMHYDAEGPAGWLCQSAESADLVHWHPLGQVLPLGPPGAPDAASASYCTTVPPGGADRIWHMFYLGTPNATPPPDRVPQFPYATLEADAASPHGPWIKRTGLIPFQPVPGSYDGVTASPGQVVRDGKAALMFFSAAQLLNGHTLRTIGIARDGLPDERWQVDRMPILPPTEQVENSALFRQADGTWFLFTNHVGLTASGAESTDAIWVYWSRDLEHWNQADKALVLDGSTSSWAKAVIGLPSVLPDRAELDVFYDGLQSATVPEGLAAHMNRDIGLVRIALPIRLPR